MFKKKKVEVDPDAPGFTLLNVGTRILAKDVMDQFIRTLGNHRTHYAATGESAERVINEREIDVLILEYDINDMTSFRLHQILKDNPKYEKTYRILAMEAEDEPLMHLASEMNIDAFLIKPFTANDLEIQIKKYVSRINDKKDLDNLLRELKSAGRLNSKNIAHKLADHITDKFPDNSRANYLVGEYYRDFDNDLDLADRYFRQSMKMNPDFVPALNALGEISLQKEDFGKAYQLLSKAQRLSPLNYLRAIKMVSLHRKWAMDELKSALSHNQRNEEILFELGKLQVDEGKYVEALRTFEKGKFKATHPFYREADILIQVCKKLGGIKNE